MKKLAIVYSPRLAGGNASHPQIGDAIAVGPRIGPRRARGAMSMEYLMLLGCIVIPLALMAPSIYHMIALYSHRVINVIALPFG